MATITINISDEMAKAFRETVKRKLGERKGMLGKAIEEAVEKWVEEENQTKIAERQIAMMRKGLYSLKGWKFNREEIYDRVK